ncbi:hypothetical protein [Streptosporangium sp. LJ11]|uniref:hypothetical protein n=1 Tax=Streptosporangium sp. LJ11 TaxID=3436927 RepID=UPI003F7912B8
MAGEVRAAGRMLADLLLEERYRRRWSLARLRDGSRGGGLNQSAVAQVLALYLWESGRRSESEVALRRELKDRVNRALRGEVLSAETLSWFVGAFEMSRHDSDLLFATRFPAPSNASPAVSGTLRQPQFVPIRQRHRTVSVFERRVIGSDGHPCSHRTIRAILACEDGVDFFPYRLFRGAVEVKVLRGGYVAAMREFTGSTPVLEIALNSPLREGQVASLEYEVSFRPGTGDADLEYRRVAHARADNVDIVVQFDPGRRPHRLWWTIWDDHRDGKVIVEEPAALDRDACVHRFVPYLEHAAAGFRWTW